MLPVPVQRDFESLADDASAHFPTFVNLQRLYDNRGILGHSSLAKLLFIQG